MDDPDFGEWRPIASAPRDGSRVLVAVRASEQGPAEVDMARWARPDRSAEECWVAVDSDPDCQIVYADAELVGWMPLPSVMPRLRPRAGDARRRTGASDVDEVGGSGI
jgi:hypothetical protein